MSHRLARVQQGKLLESSQACLQVPVQDILSSPCMPPLERLARLTHGYAGSDIRDVVHHGTPQDEEMDKITYESLLQGLTKVRYSETPSTAVGGQDMGHCDASPMPQKDQRLDDPARGS